MRKQIKQNKRVNQMSVQPSTKLLSLHNIVEESIQKSSRQTPRKKQRMTDTYSPRISEDRFAAKFHKTKNRMKMVYLTQTTTPSQQSVQSKRQKSLKPFDLTQQSSHSGEQQSEQFLVSNANSREKLLANFTQRQIIVTDLDETNMATVENKKLSITEKIFSQETQFQQLREQQTLVQRSQTLVAETPRRSYTFGKQSVMASEDMGTLRQYMHTNTTTLSPAASKESYRESANNLDFSTSFFRQRNFNSVLPPISEAIRPKEDFTDLHCGLTNMEVNLSSKFQKTLNSAIEMKHRSQLDYTPRSVRSVDRYHSTLTQHHQAQIQELADGKCENKSPNSVVPQGQSQIVQEFQKSQQNMQRVRNLISMMQNNQGHESARAESSRSQIKMVTELPDLSARPFIQIQDSSAHGLAAQTEQSPLLTLATDQSLLQTVRRVTEHKKRSKSKKNLTVQTKAKLKKRSPDWEPKIHDVDQFKSFETENDMMSSVLLTTNSTSVKSRYSKKLQTLTNSTRFSYVFKEQSPVFITNPTYVLKRGKIQSTVRYAAESPFVSTQPMKIAPSQLKSSMKSRKKKKRNITEDGQSWIKIKNFKNSQGNTTSGGEDNTYTDEDGLEDLSLDQIQEQNLRLKEELDAKMLIFEQYMKVAKLAQEQNDIELLQERQERGISARNKPRASKFSAAAIKRPSNLDSGEDIVEFSRHKGSFSPSKKSSLAGRSLQSSGHNSPFRLALISISKLPFSQRSIGHLTQLELNNIIQHTWLELDTKRNSEYIGLENMLKQKRKELIQIARENQLESELLRLKNSKLRAVHDQVRKINVDPKLMTFRLMKDEDKLEIQVKKEISRRDELLGWGFNSYVIEFRIKVRMMEDLVDKAQRLHLRPDAELEREVKKMKHVRDQTFDDLQEYVKEREKHHWRKWDNWKETNVGKQTRSPHGLIALEHHRESTKQQRADRKWECLSDEWDYMSTINKIMLPFVNKQSNWGGNGWIQLMNLSKLRDQQGQQTMFEELSIPEDQSQSYLAIETQPSVVNPVKEEPTEIGNHLLKVPSGVILVDGPPQEPKVQEVPEKPPVEVAVEVKVEKVQVKPEPVKSFMAQTLAARQESKWVKALQQERDQKDLEIQKQKSARFARIAHLFDDSDLEDVQESENENSDRDEHRLDQMAARENLNQFFRKVDHHLNVEVAMIQDWEKNSNKPVGQSEQE